MLFVWVRRWWKIYIFWNSMSFNFVQSSQVLLCWQVLYLHKIIGISCWVVMLAWLCWTYKAKSALSEISLLVAIWLCCNFCHCQAKGNYLVRTIMGIRKLPKGFQKQRYTFIFLLSNNSSESLFPFKNTLKGK